VNRKSYFETKKAKKLPAYWRVQNQLAETLLRAERLRLLCVTQRMVHAKIQDAREGRMLDLIGIHNQRDASLCNALRDLLAMLDASSFGGHKTYRCLTPFEVARLAEIRKLVKP
jgi:hypothetical protein